MFAYHTNVDGLGNIETDKQMVKEELFVVEDNIYTDNSLYKIRSVNNDNLEAKLVKTLNLQIILEDVIENHNAKQLFLTEYGYVFSETRPNQNQVVCINQKYYQVDGIDKTKPYKTLKLTPLNVVETTSIYYVYEYVLKDNRRVKQVYKKVYTWKEAISLVGKMRSKRNGNYYTL